MDKNLDKAIFDTIQGGIRSLLLLFICVGFLGIGMVKLVSLPEMVAYFKVWNIPSWAMYSIGVLEILLSVMIFYLPTRVYGLVGLISLMMGASILHVSNGEINYLVAPALILFGGIVLLLIEIRVKQKK